jgi:D-alanyl-D-alanine carboxypeptidase (penicillin-binding protein 5/6)
VGLASKNEPVAKPRGGIGAAALFVLTLVFVVAAVSSTITHGAPSETEPVELTHAALLLTPDVEPYQPAGDTQSGAIESVATNEPDQAAPPETTPPTDAAESANSDAITATHFFAYDAASGSELTSRDPDQEVAIASTAKIATALVVVRNADLDEEVAIEPSDLVDPMVQSNMGLVAGDTLTVQQLLQGLLIPSGSDAANALARHVGAQLGGDADPAAATGAFVDAMNAYVEELGLQHTHFTNPAGDDDPDAHSSARDIALLGAELMKDETLAEIVGQSQYSFTSVGEQAQYEGVTTNQLLGEDGVIGIKTGSTEQAGGCVILARETGDGLQVVAVLGSALTYQENVIVQDVRWDDARQLLRLLDAASP